MKKKIYLISGLLTFLFLQGCILELFLAPKISADKLPGPVELNALKTAYVQHCASCHQLIDPAFYRQGHSIQTLTQRYVKAKVLNQKEAKMVVTYIQALAIQSQP